MVSRPESRRGQLILVGAIVIATVIIGLTVLVNSVLYTETVGSESINNRISDASQSDFEIRKGVRSLILRVNQDERNVTTAMVEGRTARNVERYSRLLGEVQATARPVGVIVNYSNVSTLLGTRIVQEFDAEMSNHNGGASWSPMPLSEPHKAIGWFTMNVNVKNTSQTQFAIEAENRSGDTLRLTFNKTVNSTIRINSNASFLPTPNPTTECDPSNNRVLVDVVTGTAFTGDCSFVGLDVMTGPDGDDSFNRLRFIDGNEQEGKFSIVFNRSTAPNATPTNLVPCAGASRADSDPCWHPVVWRANVTAAVSGEDLSYTNQYNITIYSKNR